MMKRCETCNIELDEHDFASHVLGKKHLKKIESANFKKDLIETSVFVSRLPPGITIDGVVGFFKQFGVIEKCKLEANFAIIQFKKRETANFLLTRPIWMGGHKLYIKRRRLPGDNNPNQAPPQEKETSAAEKVFAEVKKNLESETTFDGELSAFLKTVQLNEEDVENNWRSVHSSLVEALKPGFPNCKINRFGSSVTGLCFKGSDFDVYLNIGQPIHDDEEKTSGWTPRTIFKEVKSLLYKRKNNFEKIVPIPRAKTPIIKFCHAPTNTNCDISFKNGLGVINSELIKQMLNADVRLKPLMIIIKFWATNFELSGCGKFTNYAIVMMLIFYLQQPEVNLLPPIVDLQKTCEPEYHWGWQVNFDRKAIIPKSANNSSILELLQGFFKFYLNFNFDKNLISPLDGFAHLKDAFAKAWAEKSPDADNLAVDRPVCLQDPIELNNNITAGVSGKVLETFKSFCSIGFGVCGVALENKEKPFLLDLFTTMPAPLEKKACVDIIIPVRKTLLAGLPKDYENIKDSAERIKFRENNWYSVVQALTEDAFRRVFYLDVQTINNDREMKQQKVEATSDVHSKDCGKIVLECTGTYCVMSGRKAKSFCLDPTLGPIDKEALISLELVNKQKESGVKGTKIDFTCTVLRERNPTRLILRLKDRNSAKKRFRPLASYLSTKLPSIIDKELIHMLQYNKQQVSSTTS